MCRLVLILLSLLLVGCADHQSDQQQQENKAAAAAAAAGVAAIDDAKCQSFGYQPGSSGYRQCRESFDNQHAQMSHE
jgi:uncharacterized protein YcfL